MNWADFRTQIRRSILKDSGKAIWSDDTLLLDLCGWALDTLCAHTAAVSSVTMPAPVSTSFALPDNLFSDLETTGLVYLQATDCTRRLRPSLYGQSEEGCITFNVWNGAITFSETLPTSEDLIIRYFASYPHPVLDSDLITAPAWALGPLAHLIGALALTSESIASAEVNQWKGKKDSGTPEDNALRIQQSHLLDFYERELARYPRQRREGFWV